MIIYCLHFSYFGGKFSQIWLDTYTLLYAVGVNTVPVQLSIGYASCYLPMLRFGLSFQNYKKIGCIWDQGCVSEIKDLSIKSRIL